jgi:type I restriction enzyme S subunit
MIRSVSLGDLVRIKRGTTYKSALLGQPGPVLLGLASISRNGGFRSDSLKTYGGDSPPQLLVKPGEIFASLKDVTQSAELLGSVARVPTDGPIGRLTQDTVRLDIVSEAVDPAYLYACLLTPTYREFCRVHATGTTNLGLPREDFLSYQVTLPPLEEQRRIAGLFAALDDLIETNLALAQRANELWRALVGRVVRCGDKSCGLALSNLADFVNGKNFTKGATGTGLPVIRTPEVRSGPDSATPRSDEPAHEDNIAHSGDILFVWSGSLLVGRWPWKDGLVNQHIFKVLPKEGVPDWLVMSAIENLMVDFLGVAADKATTMGHIKRSDLGRMTTVPTPDMWESLDPVVRPLWDQALASRREAAALTDVRDQILPSLMSGQVRVQV